MKKLPAYAPHPVGWHHDDGGKCTDPPGVGSWEKGIGSIPRYVVLVNWTGQGIKNVKQTIERTDPGGEIAEKHGLSAHLLEIGSLGNVRTNHPPGLR